MISNQRVRIVFCGLSAIFLILIDQISKYIIRTSGGFYICNANLAFSVKPIYAVIFFIVALVILIGYQIGNNKLQAPNSKQIPNDKFETSKQKLKSFGFRVSSLFDICYLNFGIWLIVSGAISNIIDRIYFGCVIDFINLSFWPVFNLADVYITSGAFFAIIKILFVKR